MLALANKLGAPLLTSDKDFGELVFRRRLVHAGVILFRLAGLPGSHKAEIISSLLRSHAAELPGTFTLVTPNQVRIRAEVSVGQ